MTGALGLKRTDDRAEQSSPGSLGDTSTDVPASAILDDLTRRDVVTDLGNSVRPTPAFAARWEASMERLAGLDPHSLADETRQAARGAATTDAVRSERDRWYVVLGDGSGRVAGETWIPRPKAIAETAAVQVLAETGVAPAVRPAAATALSMFLSSCPDCGGAVTERAAGGCCGPPMRSADGSHRTALVCRECGVHLHVFD